MADDYVDEDGWIRWVEPQQALAPVPVRDERDEEGEEDGDQDDDDEGDDSP